MSGRKFFKILTVSLLVLQAGNAFSQIVGRFKSQFKIAEEQYNQLHFISAIKTLNEVLAKDSTNVKAIEMMAYGNRNIRNYKGALKWFEKLSNQPEPKPIWALHYAEALANNQKYELAENWYRKYLKLIPSDKRAKAFVKSGIFSQEDNAEWKVEKTKLSTAADEYAPIYYHDGILFASNRLETDVINPVFGWNQKPYSNLYYIKDIKSISARGDSSSSPKGKVIFNDDDTAPTSNDSYSLGEYNNDWVRSLAEEGALGLNVQKVKGKVNSKYNEGPGVLLPEGAFIFTRNNYKGLKTGKSRNGTVKLKMYIAKGANWNKIQEFPFNNDEYSVGHPAVSKDGRVMIFSSDMPTGQGGVDLYFTVRAGEGKKWTKPINMGPKINTEGDEMFPYFVNDHTLLFASTGYAGFGGLDIFEVQLKDYMPVSNPKNLGAPMNSFADDFAMIRSPDGKSGYFSSNRDGSDDIYYYSRQKFHVFVKGTLTDASKLAPLGAEIYLRHAGGIDTLKVGRKGEFAKELAKETDYEVIGEAPGYVSKRVFISTNHIGNDSTLVVNIRLDKSEKAQQWVSNNCDSLKQVFRVKNIYYDLDRAIVREDAKPTLNVLADLMLNHKEISVITSSHCDSRASVEYNRALSLRRGEAARAYLISRGIAPNRVRVEYYGKSRLVNRCTDEVPCSEEDQQLNRRTEFDIIINGVNLTQMNCGK